MRILIVEDEYLIASGAASALSRAGFDVVGMTGSIDRAMQMIAGRGCDAVVLDANLDGVSAAPVAAALLRAGIPFVVVSGYAHDQRDGPLAEAPFLGKPYAVPDLVSAVFALRG